MKRRKQETGAPDLGASTISVLLGGWSAEPPTDVPREHGFSNGYLELYAINGLATLWRLHEPWLREKASEWGWKPTFTLAGTSGAMFYAERAAAGGED